MTDGGAATALDELRAYLLPRTLEHAALNSPFYREWFKDAWREVVSPSDLPRLPLLQKSVCVAEQDRMRCGPAPNDFGSISSGTTRVGSRFFRVERCQAESDALDEFYTMVGAAPALLEMPLTLHILTPNHGLPTTAPPPHVLRIAWAYSRNIMDLVEQALREDLQGRKITVLRASVSVLKQLTVWFRAAGIDPRDFGVQQIGTFASLLTPRWRDVFERAWGARITDNYSLSEFKTAATECEGCGWYHFTEPPLIAEFLDPRTDAPTDDAVAHLVLTGLYPYVQRTPLIRYATNDLVLRGPPCPHQARPSIRFLGRRHQTLFDEQHWLLFPALLEAAVDDETEVARHIHPSERAERVAAPSVGDPKYRAALRDGRVVVSVGVAWDPYLFPERARALQERLRARLLALHPDLVRSGRVLEVELLPSWRDDDFSAWFVKYTL